MHDAAFVMAIDLGFAVSEHDGSHVVAKAV